MKSLSLPLFQNLLKRMGTRIFVWTCSSLWVDFDWKVENWLSMKRKYLPRTDKSHDSACLVQVCELIAFHIDFIASFQFQCQKCHSPPPPPSTHIYFIYPLCLKKKYPKYELMSIDCVHRPIININAPWLVQCEESSRINVNFFILSSGKRKTTQHETDLRLKYYSGAVVEKLSFFHIIVKFSHRVDLPPSLFRFISISVAHQWKRQSLNGSPTCSIYVISCKQFEVLCRLVLSLLLLSIHPFQSPLNSIRHSALGSNVKGRNGVLCR